MTTKPKNWPDKSIYMPQSIYPGESPASFHLAFRAPTHTVVPILEKKTVYLHAMIRKITANHPLAFTKDPRGKDQYGLFAKKTIAPKTILGEYAGEIRLYNEHTVLETTEGCYTWLVQMNGSFWHINASRFSNEMAYVNDYHRISPTPNAKDVWVEHRGFYYFCYETLNEIHRGEEILVDYGELFKKSDLPLP